MGRRCTLKTQGAPSAPCGLDVTTVVLGPALSLRGPLVRAQPCAGAGETGEQVVRGAGPAAGPASPSRKHSSDVAQGNGLQEGTRRPCARGHRMRQPPLPTRGRSHRGPSDSGRIQTSRGAHGQKPSRARESQGLGGASVVLSGAWGR